MKMVEKVARALALQTGGKFSGPGQSIATREFGWKGDGEHFEQYVEAHWKKHVSAALFAIEAMRDPTEGMKMAGHAALDASDASEADIGSRIGFAAIGDTWRAMINTALDNAD